MLNVICVCFLKLSMVYTHPGVDGMEWTFSSGILNQFQNDYKIGKPRGFKPEFDFPWWMLQISQIVYIKTGAALSVNLWHVCFWQVWSWPMEPGIACATSKSRSDRVSHNGFLLAQEEQRYQCLLSTAADFSPGHGHAAIPGFHGCLRSSQ
jgi:hypothetical protein